MPNAQGLLDRRALSAVFQDPQTLLAFERLMKQALVDTPEQLGASLTAPNFAAQFGGVGDGVTNNDDAFAAAEASTFAEIYLPEGSYFCSTRTQAQFNKHYTGPGKIVIAAATMPGRFTYIATPRPSAGTGATLFFASNTDAVEPEWHITGPGTRKSLTGKYFEAAFMPHPVWHDVYDGASGKLSSLAAPAAIGDGAITLASADGMQVGGVYGLAASMDAAITDTITVDGIAGPVVTFHPALTTGYAAGAVLMDGHRTFAGAYYSKTTNYAAGDCYGSIRRVIQAYQPKAGQTHFFETATVSPSGHAVQFLAGTSGTYATGFEGQYDDGGEDVAVIAEVHSFDRHNDAGARSVVWLGTLFKSEGTKPADAAHVILGAWRVGLDTVKADLSSWLAPGDGYNAAISTALGHRWIMNSTANNAGRGGSATWGTLFGNTPGDMFIESGTDINGDFIALRFNGAAGVRDARLRLRTQSVTTNVDFFSAANIQAGAALVTNAANPQVIWGAGSGIWIEKDPVGGGLRGTKNAGTSFTVLF